MAERVWLSQLIRHLALVEHAEVLAGLGAWEWTPARDELLWSDNLFRLYGLEPGALTPTPEYVLERIHRDDREAVEDMLAASRRGEMREVEYRFWLDDGSLRVLRAIPTLKEDHGGRHLRLVGSVLDLTDRRRMEHELVLWSAVTQALNLWTAFEPGAEQLLKVIGTALKASFGTLWVFDGAFAARAIWHAPQPELARVASATRAWQPGIGAPSIGAAYSTQEPVSSTDVTASVSPARASALDQAAITSAVAIPAPWDGQTLAVLEFLSAEPLILDDGLKCTLGEIGCQIGRFLSRRRAGLEPSILTEREIQVLQLAARGRSAEAISAELHLSPATIKRHFERAYERLGVSDRAAAVAEAMRLGLVV